MKRPDMKMLAYCLMMCIATGFITYTFVIRQNKKIGVVDAVKLFDGYNMKKELEGKAKGKLQMLSKQLDSIGNKLQLAHATKNAGDEKMLMNAYDYLKQNLQGEYTQSNQDINTQVWKRLNAIVDEYGKKHQLHLIIGANGMGSVLYNDDYYDMTNDVIKYANERYEKGN